jgi:hypothetical protein
LSTSLKSILESFPWETDRELEALAFEVDRSRFMAPRRDDRRLGDLSLVLDVVAEAESGDRNPSDVVGLDDADGSGDLLELRRLDSELLFQVVER